MKTLLASTAGFLFAAATAFGHGSMANPISRTYQGFLENPQSPQSNAVLAAIAVGGTQAFYDWNEVSRNILDYDYQAAIPDGQIPGAGRKKYAGLNLARTDWPATMVVAGPRACRFYTTTPHDPSFFKAYMTRDGYDPNLPLTWADLLEIPGAETATLSGPCNQGGDACHCGTMALLLRHQPSLRLRVFLLRNNGTEVDKEFFASQTTHSNRFKDGRWSLIGSGKFQMCGMAR